VITSQGCNRNSWLWIAGLLGMVACGPAPATVSGEARLPTFAVIVATPTAAPGTAEQVNAPNSAAPLPEADQLRQEQAMGADMLAVTFYTDASQNRCLRFAVKGRSEAAISACSSAITATLLAVQGVETDSAGAVFTVIVGRTFSDQITAVSLELADGSNTPAEVTDRGFAVVLPGKRTAIRAIPIDQYGNLVGDKFVFK
jgi:hypothetical protein